VSDPTSLPETRLRDRQGRSIVIDGAPCPDPATTASLLPGVIVGEYLRRHADRIGGRLLDLGAGNRPFADWYEPRCSSAISTDIAAHDGLSALSTAELLPFADRSFDTVLATEVLEHVTDHEATLDEIVRVLAPGGRVVVTVPFLYPIHEAPHDHRRLTSHGLEAALTRRGLVIDDLSAKGGAFTLAANVVSTVAVAAVRAAAARAVRSPATDPTDAPSGELPAGLQRRLVAVERAMLQVRGRAAAFPGSARRVSLGYMAIATKP
jgi:SAM-dependent methyltransferase